MKRILPLLFTAFILFSSCTAGGGGASPTPSEQALPSASASTKRKAVWNPPSQEPNAFDVDDASVKTVYMKELSFCIPTNWEKKTNEAHQDIFYQGAGEPYVVSVFGIVVNRDNQTISKEQMEYIMDNHIFIVSQDWGFQKLTEQTVAYSVGYFKTRCLSYEIDNYRSFQGYPYCRSVYFCSNTTLYQVSLHSKEPITNEQSAILEGIVRSVNIEQEGWLRDSIYYIGVDFPAGRYYVRSYSDAPGQLNVFTRNYAIHGGAADAYEDTILHSETVARPTYITLEQGQQVTIDGLEFIPAASAPQG